MKKAKLYCFRSGQMGIAAKLPKGALPIMAGEKQALNDIVEATGRLAYDNKTWLVPGIPEAQSDAEALNALIEYRNWIAPRLDSKERPA